VFVDFIDFALSVGGLECRAENLLTVDLVDLADLEVVGLGLSYRSLGTGGGGSPYSSMLRLRETLRAGGVVRVINPVDLKDDDLVGCGGGAGSPTVSIEKLQGDECVSLTSGRELY